MVLAATPNQQSSGLLRCRSTATSNNESMALMLCPSALSAPTKMRYFYAYNAIFQAPHTMRRVDVVLAATPNQHSSGHLRAWSTLTIVNESIYSDDAVAFCTIRTDINGPFLHSKGYIAAATHYNEVRCVVGGHPNSGIIRAETSL